MYCVVQSQYTVPAISLVVYVFPPVYLHEILLKIYYHWQFWILLVLRIPKHPQNVEFDEDLDELLKFKHNTSHMKNFQLLSKQQSL